ncbi:putative quinol monooxygenase [Paracoccus aerodenitrificans]|uniref:putative quinol monooxygenase n=1 Tax=Paracoccus aerodenitrificans TaxID=3017781 RepID=UPI0022EFDAFD|nr:antibiotic biosynthesis monooxygenase [Paracoccus aerodenitrificans]WBU65028.1 antibiotic biosynthesis monooxygenase [Paracoccus aerodenitrificans]
MSCNCGQTHAPISGNGRPAPSKGQIALSGQLICANGEELLTVLEHLPAHIAASRAELGCLYFDIVQTEDPLIWQVEELFADLDAVKAHKTRITESTWAEKTAGIARDIHRIDG